MKMCGSASRKRPRPPGDDGENAKERKKARLNKSIAGVSLDQAEQGQNFINHKKKKKKKGSM